MRVILSCLQSLRKHDIPAYEFWRTYFVEGCREAGIEPLEVPDVDWAEGLTFEDGNDDLGEWKARTWEKTLAFSREQQMRGGVGFFLGYLYPWQVDEAAIRELQRSGIPCVNFFCDNLREFRKIPAAYQHFDLHWVPEYEALPMYRKAGLPHVHAPMPCWVPERYRSLPAKESGLPTFIGTADVLRHNLFSEAFASGADFTVCGRGWADQPAIESLAVAPKAGLVRSQFMFFRRHGLAGLRSKIVDKLNPPHLQTIPSSRAGRMLSSEDYVRITREAPVTLGVSRVPSPAYSLRNPVKYSRLRDIEAPMLGACYLTEYTEGLASLYEIGKEVEAYTSPDDLTEKLKHLSRSPEKRRQLRIAGQRRALTDHSVARSLLTICKHLEILSSKQIYREISC